MVRVVEDVDADIRRAIAHENGGLYEFLLVERRLLTGTYRKTISGLLCRCRKAACSGTCFRGVWMASLAYNGGHV
jgi:hypothetical protein